MIGSMTKVFTALVLADMVRRGGLPLRVTFQVNDDGRVSGLLIHPPRGQKVIPAARADK